MNYNSNIYMATDATNQQSATTTRFICYVY